MKILLISQWYKPLRAAAANRTSRIAEHLAKKHQVTVLTGMPSYPTGILPEKYRRKIVYKEKIENVDVLRTYEFPAENIGVIKRLINNISFMISSTIAIIFLSRFDLVIVSSPPFLGGIAALVAKTLFKCKMVFDIRDLWPDSAIELGFANKKYLVKALEALEKTYYKNADKITVVTPDMKNHLEAEKISSEKIVEFTNSVNTDIFAQKKVLRKDYGLNDSDFIIGYTGNLGAAQGLDISIKAAELLKNKKNIKFLFVGEGEEKERLINLTKKKKIDKTVLFWQEVPKEKVIDIINMVDCCNISLAGQKIFQQAVPSKALEYFACGKPVIASIGGILKRYIEEYQTGIVYDANDPRSMAEAIIRLEESESLRKKMGQNARKLAEEKFSDKSFYNNLDRIIKTIK